MSDTVTHAPICHTIDGREYQFEPLTFQDMESIELALKARAIEAGRLSIPANTPNDEAQQMMLPVCEAANKINVFSDDGAQMMLSPAGVVRMMCCMLQHRHPDVSMRQCSEWLQDGSLLVALIPKIKLLMSSKRKPTTDNKGSGGGPTRPSQGNKSSARSSKRGRR